jgi:hypothetical protein
MSPTARSPKGPPFAQSKKPRIYCARCAGPVKGIGKGKLCQNCAAAMTGKRNLWWGARGPW